MEIFSQMVGGLELLLRPSVIMWVSVGVVWGSIAGALPGFNTMLAIGVMMPLTFALGPVNAIVFLMAIAVGIMYGNSIPAILAGIPGNAAAVLTAIEGHTLHKRGESGAALGASYLASVSGQLVSTLFFVMMIVPLAAVTYHFHAPELFALTLLGMTALVSLTGKNVVKGLLAATLGLGLTVVGPDPIATVPRFWFGVPELRGGLHVVPVTLGLLAVSEITVALRQSHDWSGLERSYSEKFPRMQMRRLWKSILGGSVIGTLVGSIPGMSGIAASAISYQQAKLVSKRPEEFGHGSLEGIAANEASQNASTAGEMVPTLGLGIPGSDSAVLILSALTIHGLVPGPRLVEETPEMLHAAVAGLLGGTVVLGLTGWVIARLLLRAVSIDRRLVYTLALVLIMIGVYSLRQSTFDLIVLLGCGLLGYFMVRYGYSTAAAAIAVVLGDLTEGYLRRGLNLVDNDWVAFVTRPITGTVLLVAIGIFLYGIRGSIRLSRADREQREHEEAEELRG